MVERVTLAGKPSLPEEERTSRPWLSAPVTCAQCGQTGLAGRQFCGSCGSALWRHCPGCAATIAAADRFCPACGVELGAVWREREAAARQQIAVAKSLASQHHYDEALVELHKLTGLNDPCLAALAREVAAEISALQVQRAEAHQKAAQVLARAQQLEAEGRWIEARECLATIPWPLRDPAVVALDRDLASRVQEEASLREQIAKAVAERQVDELAHAVERLRSLRPRDAVALKLAHQLRQHMVRLARKQLAAHRYRAAVRALQCIPPSATDDEVRTLQEEASELAALHCAISEAPYADAALAGLLRRLARLAPNDPDVQRWRKTLAQRFADAPPDPRWPAPAWASSAPRSPQSLDVQFWAYPSRAGTIQDEARKTLQQHPGQFFTALGLALEALGLTSWTCDLSPPREGLLARLPTFSWQAPRAVWALDLGSSAVKALRVARDERQVVRIDAAVHLPVETSKDAGQLGRFEEPLRNLAAKVAAAPALVCVAVPGRAILGRFFTLPAIKGRAGDQALHYEAQHQLPLPLSELCWQAFVLPDRQPRDGRDPAPMRRVVLQAAQRSYVEQLLGVCRTAGLEVARLQSEPLALHHVVQWELAEQANTPDKTATTAPPVLLIDVGLRQTLMVTSAANHLTFRTLLEGSEEWSRRLAHTFATDLATGQQWLCDPAACPHFHQWQAAMRDAFDALAREIERYRTSFTHEGEPPICRWIGVGGGAQTSGLIGFLRGGEI